MPLRVLSLNIWNRSGPWKERVPLIREWVERLDPDLIGLQEVLRGDSVDQVAEILGDRRYDVHYESAIPFWEDAGLGFGNAVCSRWPISERDGVALPDGGDGERRVATSVTIESPHGPLAFTSTHLNWRFHHGWVREKQVVALCDHVRARRPRGGYPPILVGDFNAEPHSTEIRYATGLHAIDGRSVYFVDAWHVAGHGSDGITWSNRNAYAARELEPDRRIDYVFVGPPQRPGGLGRVESCRVVCDEGRDGVWPSDHLGIYAELRTEPIDKP